MHLDRQWRAGELAYFRGRQYEIDEILYQAGAGGWRARMHCPVYGGTVETNLCNLEREAPALSNLIPMPRRGWVPQVIEGGLSHG